MNLGGEVDLCVALDVDDVCTRCGVGMSAAGSLCRWCLQDDDWPPQGDPGDETDA